MRGFRVTRPTTINYQTDAPEYLRDRLESLIVQRASDEVKLAEGVVKVGESLIV